MIEGVPVGFIQYSIAAPDSSLPRPWIVQAVILKEPRRSIFTFTTFVPATQPGYRMDECDFIRKLLINGKL